MLSVAQTADGVLRGGGFGEAEPEPSQALDGIARMEDLDGVQVGGQRYEKAGGDGGNQGRIEPHLGYHHGQGPGGIDPQGQGRSRSGLCPGGARGPFQGHEAPRL